MAEVILFLLASVVVAADYMIAAVYQYWLSRQTEDRDVQRFLIGKAGILFIGGAKDVFWILIILLGTVGYSLREHPPADIIATALIIALNITAVVNRHRFWRQIHTAAGVPEKPNGAMVRQLPEEVLVAMRDAVFELEKVTGEGDREDASEVLVRLTNLLGLYSTVPD